LNEKYHNYLNIRQQFVPNFVFEKSGEGVGLTHVISQKDAPNTFCIDVFLRL